jgi:hypothetical protein
VIPAAVSKTPPYQIIGLDQMELLRYVLYVIQKLKSGMERLNVKSGMVILKEYVIRILGNLGSVLNNILLHFIIT